MTRQRASEPVVYPMGRAAVEWVLEGGKPRRGPVGISWLYRWHQFWFEWNLRALDTMCSPEEALRPPVFILGMWRSGTTFLHDLLHANRTLLAPTTWQCMNSSLHALHRPPADGAFATRPTDGFSVTADSPQEDEFALLAMGVPSVYRAFFDPRRLMELERWLDPQSWIHLPSENWWPQWRRFLASVERRSQKRLLLKSPNHTFRVQAILPHLPESAFVWMLRNPCEVFVSNVKMWKMMFHRYALWEVEETTLDLHLHHFLETALRFSTQCLREAVAELPQRQLAVVRFEDLVMWPSEILESIHERLGIPWGRVDRAAFSQSIALTESLARAPYSDQLLPDGVKAILSSIMESYQSAYESHGIKHSMVRTPSPTPSRRIT